MGSGLLAVDLSYFKFFGENLEYVDLQKKNAIRFLNGNLFKDNTNLKVVNLWDNPIEHIKPAFLHFSLI